jgi:acyl-CoA synthetase (AMP-forming)/AMP-acid ligase II
VKQVKGQMMQMPMLVSELIAHAARYFSDVEIVSSRPDQEGVHRYTWLDCEVRARRLAHALAGIGVEQGERVGTLAFNSYRHLELYYAISGSGSVCHTVNPRLPLDQMAYVISHAQDGVVFFDVELFEHVVKLAPLCQGVRVWVCMADEASVPVGSGLPLLCYETLLASGSDAYEWPQLDENAGSCLCYTSGTTGIPKGVMYSHRSTVLHAMSISLPDVFNCSASETILPVVPMFHANAWGLIYAAALVGAKLVLPGSRLDGFSLHKLIVSEGVTFAAGVPTVWLGILDYVNEHRRGLANLQRLLVGGSAMAPTLFEAFEALGIEVVHAWGMTELSPVGVAATLLPKHALLSREERLRVLTKQGHPPFGIDIRIVDSGGRKLPHDGAACGELQVRGRWVAASYFAVDESPLQEGWFPTGDMGTIDGDGYVDLTDRKKDLIKSGGEWISSITVEHAAAEHPAVEVAACVACVHPKWVERPLLVVKIREGSDVRASELRAFLGTRITSWWVPDDVVFVDQLPVGATGKVDKRALRERFADFLNR